MICQFIFEEQSFDDITSDQSQKEGIIEWYKMMEHIEEITFKEQSELPMETTTIRKKPITILNISFMLTLNAKILNKKKIIRSGNNDWATSTI